MQLASSGGAGNELSHFEPDTVGELVGAKGEPPFGAVGRDCLEQADIRGGDADHPPPPSQRHSPSGQPSDEGANTLLVVADRPAGVRALPSDPKPAKPPRPEFQAALGVLCG